MAADGEELLDTRPPRPRRQLLIGAVVLVAAAVVAVVATRTGSVPHPAASSSRPRPTLPPAPPVAVTSGDVVATTVGDTAYAIDGGAVITIDLNTGARSVLRPAVGDLPETEYRILADPDHQRLWVIRSHDTALNVSWFDTGTLMQTGAEDDRGPLDDAAVLDGRLYLSTPARILSISQTEDVPPPALTIRPGQVIAADPSRHRLLVLRYGSATGALVAQRPGARTPQARAAAPFGKGEFAVTSGRIWAVGFGRRHAVIERLDPRTLRVQVRSPLEQHIGPGAVLAQIGRRHLLIRDAGGLGGELWCVDAGTGAVTRHWADVPGTPVLAESGIYSLVAGQPLQRVDSSGCSGG